MIPDEPDHCRRFTLSDAMILVAALAVGLAVTRPALVFLWQDLGRLPLPVRLDSWGAWRLFLFGPNRFFLNLTRFLNLIAMGFLSWLVLAALVIRLRRPRPPLRALLGQPGFAACAAPVLALGVGLALMLLPLPETIPAWLVTASAPLAWVTLIASRTWRPERGWIDRFGRMVGLFFTASVGVHLVLIRWLG